MGVVANFDPVAWAVRYPEFAAVPQPTVLAYYAEATLYHRNDGGGPVTDVNQQLLLINMVVAHIAQLYKLQANNDAASQIVGRIASASEGSVSVSAEMAPTTAQDEWFKQTKYGASYWAATRVFRTMRYLPGRPRNMQPPGFFGRGGF